MNYIQANMLKAFKNHCKTLAIRETDLENIFYSFKAIMKFIYLFLILYRSVNLNSFSFQ